ALRGKVARLEAGLARAEADLAGAVELARQVNLVPTQSTDKVIRYEAHLSRQLTQTFQLLDRLQAARAARPPAAGEWESGYVAPVESEVVSAERTQTGPERPPEMAAEPVPPAGQAVVSAERTQSAPEISPAVVVEPVLPAGRAVVSAERTQFADCSPSGALAGSLDGVIERVR
ncbi:MAG: hypothetical protein JWO38_8244, partial [Gemmataceae bacterium]|nr:hypothetical protein [Gemmataceae bacterium]